MTREEQILCRVAERLGPLRERVLFVGGSVLCLLIEGAEAPRATKDVDLVAPTASTVEYEHEVATVLRAHGWQEDDSEGAPRCRWVHSEAGLLDVVAAVESDSGSTNPWYADALRSPAVRKLGDLEIRVISAPFFIATKICAFESRGRGDWESSHDLEDVLTVLASRSSIVDEVSQASARDFLARTFSSWLEPVSSHITSHRSPSVIELHARAHFAGNDAGDEAALRALDRLRAIAQLTNA